MPPFQLQRCSRIGVLAYAVFSSRFLRRSRCISSRSSRRDQELLCFSVVCVLAREDAIMEQVNRLLLQ